MLRTVLLTLALALMANLGMAQEGSFPSKAITVVVPYPPGGTSDIIPRLIAPHLSQSLGVPVIVENRAGANGSIGATAVAKAKPDGYTLLLAPTGVLAINQFLYKALQYNPEKDFTPITNAASTPNMLVVNSMVPANNLAELIALAKSKPGALNFASAGNGSTSHLCGELLKSLAGIDMQHVPYKGVAPAQADLLAGQVSMMCDNFSNVIQPVRAGRLRAIAVADKTRHPQAPDVPTGAEAGLPGFEAGVWYGFVAPAPTPKPVIDKLNSEIARALHNPAVADKLHELGLTIVADSPEQFGKFIEAETAKWRRVVQTSGARLD